MTRDEIASRIDVIRAGLGILERLPQSTFDEFIADERNLQTALHVLQTSIQALMDLAASASSRAGLRTPTSVSRDVLAILEEATLVPAGTTARYAPIFAFRNRVVHLYDRIDPLRVYEIVSSERPDLEALLVLLLRALEPLV